MKYLSDFRFEIAQQNAFQFLFMLNSFSCSVFVCRIAFSFDGNRWFSPDWNRRRHRHCVRITMI